METGNDERKSGGGWGLWECTPVGFKLISPTQNTAPSASRLHYIIALSGYTRLLEYLHFVWPLLDIHPLNIM